MQSGADSFTSSGQPQTSGTGRSASSIFNFLRRRNPAVERDEAITTWRIVRHETATQNRYWNTHVASDLILRSPEGGIGPLGAFASNAATTILLYIGEGMATVPGLEHRLQRRASTLGPGVRLFCVTPREMPSLPMAYVDVNGTCARIGGSLKPPALISIGSDGCIFDVQSDADALLDWVWNDPRPRSRRATDL